MSEFHPIYYHEREGPGRRRVRGWSKPPGGRMDGLARPATNHIIHEISRRRGINRSSVPANSDFEVNEYLWKNSDFEVKARRSFWLLGKTRSSCTKFRTLPYDRRVDERYTSLEAISTQNKLPCSHDDFKEGCRTRRRRDDYQDIHAPTPPIIGHLVVSQQHTHSTVLLQPHALQQRWWN